MENVLQMTEMMSFLTLLLSWLSPTKRDHFVVSLLILCVVYFHLVMHSFGQTFTLSLRFSSRLLKFHFLKVYRNSVLSISLEQSYKFEMIHQNLLHRPSHSSNNAQYVVRVNWFVFQNHPT